MKRARPAFGPIDAARAGGDAEPLRILRRHRSGALRKRRRRGGLVFLATLCGAIILGGTVEGARHYLTHSRYFRLRRIEFSETRYAPQPDLRRSLARYVGRNLFRLCVPAQRFAQVRPNSVGLDRASFVFDLVQHFRHLRAA